MIHLPAAQHRAQPWKNGLGVSRIIAGVPPDADFDSVLWQVGSTEITAACPFSELRGLDRQFMVIGGAGVELTSIDDGGATRRAQVVAMQPPYSFRGDWKTNCRMLGGQVRVLNVVTRRGRAEAKVEFTQERTLKKAKRETLLAVQLDNLDAWLLSDPSEIVELPAATGRVAVVRIRATNP